MQKVAKKLEDIYFIETAHDALYKELPSKWAD